MWKGCKLPSTRLIYTVTPDVCVDTPLGGSIIGAAVALRGCGLLLAASLPSRRPNGSGCRQHQQRALHTGLGATFFVTRL